jgi:two-component system, NtrC family, nitrogen regulation sensor histidine kinase NtrY
MVYRRFYIVVIAYLLFIILFSMGFAFFISSDLVYSSLFLAAVVITTLSFGIWLNRTNRKLAFFFSAVKNEDTSLIFPEGAGFAHEKLLNSSLNELNSRLKDARINIELQETFYKSIMDKINTGIVSFYGNGVIEYVNPEFLRMFHFDHISHINKLSELDHRLPVMLKEITSGEQRRINLRIGHNLLSLAVHAQKIIIRKHEIKIVSLRDIKSELDINEMESWQKLIRILNHEIMNSVAPITSLSNTISRFYVRENGHVEPAGINEKIIADTIKGLGIIENHGKGLIQFVESYRTLTQLPKPEYVKISLSEFFERITILANSGFESEQPLGVSVVIKALVKPETLTMMADDKLLARVFINLIRNSVESFDAESTNNEIILRAVTDAEGKIVLSVKDNGRGMDQDTLEKVFVPFFTTKESGSGIGLSLSRQIIRLHNGNITCDSLPGKGTTISMIF